MKKSITSSLAWGIAFVGFTTQFGGGFASGAQIYQYFANYGIWGLAMPVLAQFLLSLFYWYGMKYAFNHKTYDYRSFSNSFYGKFRTLFGTLYEIEYFLMVCLAPAVAFATGGAILNKLTSLNYFLCTLIIGLFIFVITLFGTDIVRKCSSVLSILIILGLLVVLVPNIIAQWDTICESIHKMSLGKVPVGSKENGSFGSALMSGCVYGIFQLTAIGLMYQHTQKMRDEKETLKSMFYMFIVDAVMMEMALVGLLAIAFSPDLAKYDVPMLLLVKTGVGAKILTPIISVLIILGAVSTGVNMIAGIVKRCVAQIEEHLDETEGMKHRIIYAVIAFVFTILAFSIAQFGLIPLVKTGYAYLGYATLFVIVIPFAVHFLLNVRKR